MTLYYDPLIDFKNTLAFSGSWIMWGFYLLPNDRAMAERFYEAAKKSCLIEKPDGSAHMVAVPGITTDHPYITVRTLSLANELGDTEVVKKIRAHVEAHYEPTRDTDAGSKSSGCKNSVTNSVDRKRTICETGFMNYGPVCKGFIIECYIFFMETSLPLYHMA